MKTKPLPKWCHELFRFLFFGNYIIAHDRTDDSKAFKLMTPGAHPVRYVSRAELKTFIDIIPTKRDKHLKITLDKAKVLQLDGRSWAKKEYKRLRCEKIPTDKYVNPSQYQIEQPRIPKGTEITLFNQLSFL